MKLYDTFPYNENQQLLHLTEDRYIKNIDSVVTHFSDTQKEKKELRKKLLKEMEIVKKQDPHPAEILADFQGYFWDIDLYWIHWDWDKNLIIPRMLVIKLEESIEVLEKFYKKEDILKELKETRENIPAETYKFISERYKIDFQEPIHTKPALWRRE